MKNPKEFRDALRVALESHNSLAHPVVRALTQPKANWPLMREVALQALQLTKVFIEYIGALYYHCPVPKFKARLATNLYEEETGKLSNTKNHLKLMEDFVLALGVSREVMENTKPYPETDELIEYRRELVHNRESYHQGAAAVMIASEGQSLEELAGESRHELFPSVYKLSEKDILFFTVHSEEDVGHVNEGLALVSQVCETETMQQEALQAVHRTCELFWKFFDGIAIRNDINVGT
jgi:pyrroloquinoline-quinone synthase